MKFVQYFLKTLEAKITHGGGTSAHTKYMYIVLHTATAERTQNQSLNTIHVNGTVALDGASREADSRARR